MQYGTFKKMTLKTLVISLIATPLWAQSKDTKTQDPQAQVSTAAPAVAPTVLSFLEWKSLRVHEAQQKVEQMNKNQSASPVWQEGKGAEAQVTDGQKLNFNVDVALQLNIQDYFSMYLKNLTPEEFKEATKKLTGDDVAELLSAYKNSLEKDKKVPLKFSRSAKDNAKSKNTEI